MKKLVIVAGLLAAVMGSSVVANPFARPIAKKAVEIGIGAAAGVALDRATQEKEDKARKGSTTYVKNDPGGNMTNYAKGDGSTATIGSNNPQEGDISYIENGGNMTNMAVDGGTSTIGTNHR